MTLKYSRKITNSNMLILRLISKYKYSIDISLLILKKILKNV
ncbi:hypothetical protein SAMN05421741_12221 [Paenimyroides ummariense]|uniref:Uncharacterized protein n=1 Tax=Paenimyroides ummariense TaxID=913024 RepID=A0A1I5ERQ0_9FLAO|nr:hypothetical protein SAMN05421741_12221 [Paenimyroides ummariense]